MGQIIGGVVHVATASFTRPANTTQYATGDLVANSATAASVTPLTFEAGRGPGNGISIRRARLYKSDDDITSASFRLHLFSGDPTASALTAGDNGAISLNTAITEYLGSIDVDMTASPDIYNTAGNLAVGVPLQGVEINHRPSSNVIYGLLEARGTYTPASGETFTVALEIMQN